MRVEEGCIVGVGVGIGRDDGVNVSSSFLLGARDGVIVSFAFSETEGAAVGTPKGRGDLEGVNDGLLVSGL